MYDSIAGLTHFKPVFHFKIGVLKDFVLRCRFNKVPA